MADAITLKSAQTAGTITLVASNQTILLQGKAQGPQGIQGIQGIQGDPATNLVTSVAGRQGVVTLDKTDVGLGNAENTSDADKPVSTAQQTALNGKQDTDATLTALAAYNTNGILTQTAADIFTGRTITGTANQVNVTNGDGVGGNPTLSLPQNIHTGATPTFATPTAAGHAAIKSYVDTADAAHVAAADPHTQYMNSDRGDARYAGQTYAVMAKSQFASLSSSYGYLGKTFGNDGYKNDLQVYGLSTQASTPTPDVPVPIVSTTGNAFIRSVGNNRVIHNAVTTTVSGVTFTVNPDNSITIVGTSTAYIKFDLILNSLALPSNTNFVLSGISGGAGGTYFMELKYLKNSGNSYITTTTTPLQFSTVESVTTGSLYIIVNSGKTVNTTIYPQIEVGTEATPYTRNTSVATLPLGTTQLRSLPNGVSDRIYKDGSTWKLEQNVGTTTFTGTESWGAPLTRPNGIQFGLANVSAAGYNINNTATMYSNRFKSASFDTRDSNADSIYGVTTDGELRINTTKATTTADWKTYLAANSTTAQYPITPITTTITDPTLITALENIRTYQGVTNITASTPVSGSYGLDLTKTLAGKVDTTGNQTIAGVKTFTSAPIAPSGTSIGGALHLTGTGFPNGVVSAPVGSIYIDTAVTNGASSWIKKSGTGNTGWIVTYGDTGWREMAAGWNVSPRSSGDGYVERLLIRRAENRVALACYISATFGNGKDHSVAGFLPVGFRNTSSLNLWPFKNRFRITSSQTTYVDSILETGTAGDVRIITPSVNHEGYAEITWLTDNPWPTTLPGTAA